MTTVLAHGCFDLLHPGHIKHLEEAKKLGDRLVVSVTADKYVGKGIGRPHFSEEERANALRALACVDTVVINDKPDAVDVIGRVRPAIYVKGVDYKDNSGNGIEREKAAVEAVGGQLVFTNSAKLSSSRLINQERFSDEVLAYLDDAKERGFRDKIFAAFDAADKLKITFVGEAIIDEYRYVRGLGRASKELMLAVVETSHEAFEGGAIAASKHAEWRGAEWLPARPHIKKTRFVDADFNRKILDVYSDRRVDYDANHRVSFRSNLGKHLRDDVIVAMDFGHGLLGLEERSLLRQAKFMAVNAQSNAGNYGYNLITKYDKAHFICIDEPEARLAAGMADERMDVVVQSLAGRIKSNLFLVTHGKFGSTSWDSSPIGKKAPAFSASGIDTMGAGDAVLAVTAPLIAAGLPLEMAALVGNVAGSIKTTIVGHRRHVGRQEIIATVEALLA